jgi:hypothetical protein
VKSVFLQREKFRLALPAVILLTGMLAVSARAALDVAGNYAPAGSLFFVDGSNGGTGFTPWQMNADAPEGGFAGTYISTDPTQNGRGSIADASGQVFALYANPENAFSTASRGFADGGGSIVSMLAGEVFSFQLAFSFTQGNRGLNLYSDAALDGGFTQELLNLNHGGSDALTFSANGTTGEVFSNIYNNAVTISMTYLGSNQLRLQAHTDDVADGAFDQVLSLAGVPNGFQIYISSGQSGEDATNYDAFFNHFELVPEPSSAIFLLCAGVGAAIRRRRI